jgi:hypothetical protein
LSSSKKPVPKRVGMTPECRGIAKLPPIRRRNILVKLLYNLLVPAVKSMFLVGIAPEHLSPLMELGIQVLLGSMKSVRSAFDKYRAGKLTVQLILSH